MDNTDKEHFYWLDSMRFIAALLVLMSHTRNDFFIKWGDLPSDYHNIATSIFYLLGRVGHEAVVVFFVLSGFLVGGKAIERIRQNNFRIKDYAISRFSRITPPLCTAIFLCWIVSLILGTEFSYLTAIGNLLQLQGVFCEPLVSPLWSLNYEVWFYIMIGSYGAIYMKSNYAKYWGLFVFALSIMPFMAGLSMHYLAIWMIGAVSYMSRTTRKRNMIKWLSLISILSCVGLYQLTTASDSVVLKFSFLNSEVVECCMAVAMGIFMQQIILNKPQRKISAFIERKLGYMAKFSYTIIFIS